MSHPLDKRLAPAVVTTSDLLLTRFSLPNFGVRMARLYLFGFCML